MAFTLSNLVRDAMRYQGIDAFDVRIATGGSATTLVDTALEDKYGDDELKDGGVIVLRTTAGLAPEGEMSRISSYSESDQTITFDAMTAAVATGNPCMIITAEYPLRVLTELANDALRDCGEVSAVHSTTTTIDGATEYTLPVIAKRLVGVYLQTNLNDADNNEWVRLTNWRILPSSGNVDATIVFPHPFTVGYTLRFVYNTFHPTVSLYNSPIDEAIPAPLIVLMLADKIMQWNGVTNENSNDANKIQAELQDAKRMYPIRRVRPETKFFTIG